MARASKSGGSGPTRNTSAGPVRQMGDSKSGAAIYESKPTGKGSTAGVPATNPGALSDLKRSTPAAGIYQSGNNNRGGGATRNCDTSTDAKLTIEAPGLAALRKAQDSRSSRGSEND